MRTAGFKLVLVVLLASMAGFFAGGLGGAQARRARSKSSSSPAVAGDSSLGVAEDCKKDADCTTVPEDCCACSEGGALRAMPKKQKTVYEKARKKRCAGTMCAQVMSPDPSCARRAFCGAGICELGEVALRPDGGSPAPEPASK